MLNKGRGAENIRLKKRSPCKLIDSCTMYPAVATSTTTAYIQLAYSDVSWAVGWPWPWWSLLLLYSAVVPNKEESWQRGVISRARSRPLSM